MLELFWWGSVFLLALPVMAALLVLGPRVLPEYRDPDAGRLDLVWAAMSVLAVLAVIYGLKEIAQDGLDATALAAIVRRGRGRGAVRAPPAPPGRPDDRRRPVPLGSFNAALATNFLAIFVAVGYFLFVAQYLQLVVGLSPLEAGLWSLPSAAAFIVGCQFAPRVLHDVRPACLIGGGLALAAVGLVVLTQVGVTGGLVPLVLGSVIVSLGLAPVFGLTTELIVGSAPPERAGAASGISETGAELGGALGIAIMGCIGVAIYRGELADRLPAAVPAEAADVGPRHPGQRRRGGRAAPRRARRGRAGRRPRGLRGRHALSSALAAAIGVALAVLALIALRNQRARRPRRGRGGGSPPRPRRMGDRPRAPSGS